MYSLFHLLSLIFLHLKYTQIDRRMILPAQNTPLTKLLRMTTLRFLSNFTTFVQSANYKKIYMNNVTLGHFINDNHDIIIIIILFQKFDLRTYLILEIKLKRLQNFKFIIFYKCITF